MTEGKQQRTLRSRAATEERSIPVEHIVKIRDFTRWVERKDGSPREVMDRKRVQAILGLPR